MVNFIFDFDTHRWWARRRRWGVENDLRIWNVIHRPSTGAICVFRLVVARLHCVFTHSLLFAGRRRWHASEQFALEPWRIVGYVVSLRFHLWFPLFTGGRQNWLILRCWRLHGTHRRWHKLRGQMSMQFGTVETLIVRRRGRWRRWQMNSTRRWDFLHFGGLFCERFARSFCVEGLIEMLYAQIWRWRRFQVLIVFPLWALQCGDRVEALFQIFSTYAEDAWRWRRKIWIFHHGRLTWQHLIEDARPSRLIRFWKWRILSGSGLWRVLSEYMKRWIWWCAGNQRIVAMSLANPLEIVRFSRKSAMQIKI